MISLAHWAGGSVFISISADVTLRWWNNRRVQTVKPTVGSLTVTMQPANEYPNLPWGGPALIVINPADSSFSFTFRDTPATWSFTVPASRGVFVHRVKDANGLPTWWPMMRTLKT